MLILNFFPMLASVSPENSYSDERGPGRGTLRSVRLSLTTRIWWCTTSALLKTLATFQFFKDHPNASTRPDF